MEKIEETEDENNSADHGYITPIKRQSDNSFEEQFVFQRKKYKLGVNQSVFSNRSVWSNDETIIDGVGHKEIHSFGCWFEESSVKKKENTFIKALKDSYREDSENKAIGKIFWPNYTGSLGSYSDENDPESQSTPSKNNYN